MNGPKAPAPGSADIAEARRRLGLTTFALWVGYFEVGGNGSLADVEGWLDGVEEPSDRDHDYLAQALNDVYLGYGLDHPVPYRTG